MVWRVLDLPFGMPVARKPQRLRVFAVELLSVAAAGENQLILSDAGHHKGWRNGEGHRDRCCV
jgi:hypothetical protein